MDKATALEYRAAIERAASLLPDKDAVKAPGMYPVWHKDTHYIVDERVRYDGVLYRSLVEHDAQQDWTPTAAPSVWTKVLIPDDTKVYPWEQPASTNGHHKGDKVTHKRKTWVSDLDGNVWEPGAYGWKEVIE